MPHYKLKADVFSKAKEDGTLVLIKGDDTDFRLYQFNPTATQLLPLLTLGATREGLVQHLVERFEVGVDALTGDVDQFLAETTRLGLVESYP